MTAVNFTTPLNFISPTKELLVYINKLKCKKNGRVCHNYFHMTFISLDINSLLILHFFNPIIVAEVHGTLIHHLVDIQETSSSLTALVLNWS